MLALVAKAASIGAVLLAVLLGPAQAPAQPASAAQRPPATPREAAPIDLTGQWVAIVNEDWRWRMVTPPKGDYASVPLNDEGRRVADQWDPATDGACEAYGAAGLMRVPTRLRIRWDGDDVLVIETDAGQQTRRLLFDPSARPGPRSLQGHSIAKWTQPGPPAGRLGPPGPPPTDGHLEVTTTNLLPGWLRWNGVPYSENTVMTEYFDRFAAPNGDEWLIVTTIVDDPVYLNQRYITSSHFRLETNRDNWNPQPCGVQ